jgi:hypothetical protein
MQPKQKSIFSQSLWLYVPLWLFFIYLYIQILQVSANGSDNLIISGMTFIQFGVHEASHIVTAFLPAILCASAGSCGELLFTILIVIATVRAKAPFAMVFGLLWVALAMNNVGIYMADARAQQLQLMGPGPEPKHDWNYVFGQLGWLNSDTVIGGTVRVVGDVVGFVAIAIGLYLIVRMVGRRLSYFS